MKKLFMKPRIECSCGWWNNQPAKEFELTARCKKCGKLVVERARFLEKLKKLGVKICEK